jgi:hypothetical protein
MRYVYTVFSGVSATLRYERWVSVLSYCVYALTWYTHTHTHTHTQVQ